MIFVYYRTNCNSSKRVSSWLEKYNLPVNYLKLTQITKNDLIKLLSLSDTGMKEILRYNTRSNKVIIQKIKTLESLTFNEALDFLLKNKNLLKTPIILDSNKYMVGFQEDNIRQFIPKSYRNNRYF